MKTTVTWLPDLSGDKSPIYLAIVNALAEDVAQQRLRPGTRLPTHRDLAARLNVNVATITRAYNKARDLGLVSGEIGRGTFVAAPATASSHGSMVAGPIDLQLNKPLVLENGAFLKRTLQRLADSHVTSHFLQYPAPTGSEAHRNAGLQLASLTNVRAKADQIVLTNGAQQALLAVLGVTCRPGDAVATESLNYAGVRGAADFLNLRKVAVAIDAGGMIPESLDEVCQRQPIAAVVVTPSVHNPTTATMDLERRRALVSIAARHNVTIIEDDIYGPLVEKPLPSLFSLTEGESYYICGVSKSIASGIRVGYVFAPQDKAGAVTAAVHATTWTVAPLMAELAAQWMQDGTTRRLIALHRAEIRRRQDLARAILGETAFTSHPQSYHVWMQLPQHWRLHEFTEACAQNGVAVAPGSVFAINPTYAPNCIRIALGAQQDFEQLRAGLTLLAQTLSAAPSFGGLMV